ncbi:MAG: aldo/keto reductase [Pseudomonadota bacterium]
MAQGLSRRQFLYGAGASVLAMRAPRVFANASGNSVQPLITRAIPSSDEQIPAIGMGTWQTFDVEGDPAAMKQRVAVLKAFVDGGGSVVDSSPMYGSADEVMGHALDELQARGQVFAATKIWTGDESATRRQAETSREKWGIERFDLLQVHNLVGWRGHLKTLRAMKDNGEVRYLGITTSHGRQHREVARIMASEPLDFVQLTYNLVDREVEERLLPLARERGIGVLVNRPFRGGSLFRRFGREPLPPWAQDAGCQNWAEFFLKFIISHPAVTCAIQATSKVSHMEQNTGAMVGRLPDEAQRQRMAQFVASG